MKRLNCNPLTTLIFGFILGYLLTQDIGFFSSEEEQFFFDDSLVSSSKDKTGEEEDSHSSSSQEESILRPRGLSKESIDQWCPTAKCEVTDLCHPCTRRYLFIVATERSGATTLQWMLNSLPGIRLGGENHNMIVSVKKMIEETTEIEWWQKNHQSWKHEFYPESAFACVAQQMAETINPPPNVDGIHAHNDSDTIAGFKTTRMDRRNGGQRITRAAKFQEQVAFFLQSFPCSRFVINIRSDVKARAESQKKVFGENAADSESLKQENEMLIQMAHSMGPRQAIVVDSTRWTNDVSKVNDIVHWLGFSDTCNFESVFPADALLEQRSTPPGCRKLAMDHLSLEA